jgi:hypothetical protein
MGVLPHYYLIMNFGFDLISDLNLTSTSEFDWSSKPTSLFCIIPGNISSDINVIYKTLRHLSSLYKGIFYIDGSLENVDIHSRDQRIAELQTICGNFKNVVYLHNNVVIVDGVGLLGINGWMKSCDSITDDFQIKCYRYDDLLYLEKTIEKIQLHPDIKKLIIVSNCIPSKELLFGENASNTHEEMYPTFALSKDTEHKTSYWVYGNYDKFVDKKTGYIQYVSNGKFDKEPYYAKRIDLTI